MKATFDIPDLLYRRVKARSAIEGRPLRSVAVELFQKWLENPSTAAVVEDGQASTEEFAKYPWLVIAQRHASPDISPDMDAIRESIAQGWAAETKEKLASTLSQP